MDKRHLFGTSGIRGPADSLFTDQFSFDIGRTFVIFLDSHKQTGAIAIGMDPRGSSPRIVKAIESGILYQGREVYDEGPTPVPSMNNILLTSDLYKGSIMVSGSHIKSDLNGIKFFFCKEEILKEHEAQIEKIYFSIQEKIKFRQTSEGIHYEENAKNDYQEKLLGLAIKPYPKWSVVIDPGDGAQSDVMPFVLKTVGLEVIEMNATIQGEFFARDTEVQKDFLDLKNKVKEESADFGVGYDSDGDRVVFIDENANFIPGDFSGAIVAKYLESRVVVTPINTSQVIDHIGKEVVRTKVGSPYVVEKMKKVGASFGFEANGGGIFPNMLSRDGGRMTIEILNILSRSGKKLSELIAELPRFYVEKDKVEYKWELKDTIISEAKKRFKGIKIEELDGLKIWIDNESWVLFRSSANAPEFRVFAESKSADCARKLLEDGIALVREIINKN